MLFINLVYYECFQANKIVEQGMMSAQAPPLLSRSCLFDHFATLRAFASFIILNFFLQVMYISAFMPTYLGIVCAWCPWRLEEGINPLRTGVTDACVLITAEASLERASISGKPLVCLSASSSGVSGILGL